MVVVLPFLMVAAAFASFRDAFLTLSVTAFLYFPTCTVILTVPAFFAVTTPLEITVATLLLLVEYFTVPPIAEVDYSVYIKV